MRWDLLIRAGEVMDPGGGHIGRFDVAVHDGLIAAIAPTLTGTAATVVDASGMLVTPGLVDLHTHVHAGGGYWGIDPDPVAWHSGVTTWVDAGSAGAYTFGSLRSAIANSAVHVPVLLNISAIGLAGPAGEARDLSHCDTELAVATALAHRDLIAGFKVRMDRHNIGANGLEPLRRAVAAAEACGLPVMVHIGAAPPSIADMLPLLRPGDIITHCASGIAAGPSAAHASSANGAAGPSGGADKAARRSIVDPAARDAYEAGVLFDLGHGSGGFAFDVLEAQLEAGMVPHTVSTDLHARSLYGPVFDLPTTMAKMLAVGLSLEEVVAAATVRPSRALGLSAGTLSPGVVADIALFTLVEQAFEVSDAHGQRRHSPIRLRNEATYRAGRLLAPSLPAPPPPWIPLTDAQRFALRQRESAVRHLLATPLVGPDDLAEQFSRHGGGPRA